MGSQKWALTNAEPDHGRAPEMRMYTAKESARILEAAEGTKHYAAIVLLITTRCGLGEILGLRWEAADFDHSSTQILIMLKESEGHKGILGALKTEESQSEVPLPRIAPAALRAYHVKQTVERLKNPAGWNPLGLVFCTLVGTTINESTFRNRDYSRILQKSGVRYISPHPGGRHSGAAQMLKDGEMLHNVQVFFRHTSFSTTADIYAHLQEHGATTVGDRMDRMYVPNPEKLT
jgi:integrase